MTTNSDRDPCIEIQVREDQAGERLDAVIAAAVKEQGFSRSQVGLWIDQGAVTVNGQVATRAAFRPAAGNQIVLRLPKPELSSVTAEAPQDLNIVFEDQHLLVLNKPAGISVHPGAGRVRGTIANQLVGYLGESIQQIGAALRPGIVHRLDKDTSGLMVIAKTAAAFHGLVRQLQPPRSMQRKYLLLVQNLPQTKAGSTVDKEKQQGTIHLAIGRDPSNRHKMAVVETGGRDAETHWRCLERMRWACLVEASLTTGRTHQIRVHFHKAAAPLWGDATYRADVQRLPPQLRTAVKRFGRQALHAYQLAFVHPLSAEPLAFTADLPPDFQKLLTEFRTVLD